MPNMLQLQILIQFIAYTGAIQRGGGSDKNIVLPV